jgi:signal transduction histidine kinase
MRLPRRTIRLRLTLAYGALFLASGAALLTLTYFLARQQYTRSFFVESGNGGIAKALLTQGATAPKGGGIVVRRSGILSGNPLLPGLKQQSITAAAGAQSSATRHTLLIDSAIALGAMGVLSLWLGWMVSGRALRPLRTISNLAQEISASNLHRRLALSGPDDELRQLGNTFDDLLARLERAFEAQRRFVANASHELRTPMTLERTLLEVALADPDADAASLRRTCERVLAAGELQERLLEALLTLSRSQRGVEQREPVDLAAATAECVAAVSSGDVALDAQLNPAATRGDRQLIERLVSNLVTNAVRHNVPNGSVAVETATVDGHARLTVENTGPVVPVGQVERIFEPFQRLPLDRTDDADGLGLGLSIVQAIAQAHDATVAAEPRAGGGLVVRVDFRSSAAV